MVSELCHQGTVSEPRRLVLRFRGRKGTHVSSLRVPSVQGRPDDRCLPGTSVGELTRADKRHPDGVCLSLASRAHGFNLYVTKPGAYEPLQASLLAELKQKLLPSGDAHSFLSFRAFPAVVSLPGGGLSSHTLTHPAAPWAPRRGQAPTSPSWPGPVRLQTAAWPASRIYEPRGGLLSRAGRHGRGSTP